MIFDKQWFEKHQRIIRWFANTKIGRYTLRIHGNRSDVGKHKILLVEPNAITWTEDGEHLTTEFRTHDKFGKRLYYAFYPIWWLCHQWDMLFANRLQPAWNLGFDAFGPVYPDAGTGGTTVDGNVIRNSVDEDFATIRAGAGVTHNDTATDQYFAFLQANATSDHYSGMSRSIFTFNTSALTAGANISVATLSLYGQTTKSTGLGTTDMHIGGASPASDNDLVAADFTAIARTSFGSITNGDWSIVAYNDFTMNASGIANIDKTGISKFSGQLGWDILNDTTGLTWADSAITRYYGYFADQTGTTNDPKLTATYSLSSGAVGRMLLLGIGII